MDKEKKEKQNVVDKYLEEVIYRSWTWNMLTEEEKKRFKRLDFSQIKGTEKMRIEWLSSIWTAYLIALDYSPHKWQNRKGDQ